MINWKPLIRECLQFVKEQTDKADKNAVAGFSNNPYCKEELVGQDCIHIYVFASLRLGYLCNWETLQPWR